MKPEEHLHLSCDGLISQLYTSRLHKLDPKRYFTFRLKNDRKRLKVVQDLIIDDFRMKVFNCCCKKWPFLWSEQNDGVVLLFGIFLQTNEMQFIRSCCFLVENSHLIFCCKARRFDGKYPLISTLFPLVSKYLIIYMDFSPSNLVCNFGHLDRYSQRGSLWNFNTQTGTDKGISPSKYKSRIFKQKR